jgi:opacity protein-like surface antigen
MKESAVVALLAVMSIVSWGQPREGKRVELSISGSFQSYSSGSSSSSSSALLLSPRIGFFVTEGLEIEPEVIFMTGSGTSVYVLNGNVSYNFLIGGPAVPFLLVGYGTANTIPLFNVPFGKTSFPVGVLNLGSGVKVFLTEDVALRFEYRYQSYKGEGERVNYLYFTYQPKIETRIHSVQFGLSVLL